MPDIFHYLLLGHDSYESRRSRARECEHRPVAIRRCAPNIPNVRDKANDERQLLTPSSHVSCGKQRCTLTTVRWRPLAGLNNIADLAVGILLRMTKLGLPLGRAQDIKTTSIEYTLSVNGVDVTPHRARTSICQSSDRMLRVDLACKMNKAHLTMSTPSRCLNVMAHTAGVYRLARCCQGPPGRLRWDCQCGDIAYKFDAIQRRRR